MLISNLLWENWLSKGQRKTVIESLDSKSEDDAKKLVGFLGAIHDLGKATPAFQIQKGYANSDDLDHLLLEKLERDGFTGISSLKLASREHSHHTVAGQALLNSYGVNECISSIIDAHHGRPIDNILEANIQIKSYPANYFQYERECDEVKNKWKKCQKDLFDWALELNDFNSVDELPKVEKTGQILLSGLLIMADWIASNPDYFPLIDIDENEVADRYKRAEYAWNKWKGSDLLSFNEIIDIEEKYQDRFKFKPRNPQKVLSQVIDDARDPGIFIFEAPMGSGKTEAALIGAEQLSYKKERSGIFFALPTQATSNGIFPRIEDWLESLDEELNKQSSLRLYHGKANLNDRFLELKKRTSKARQVNIDDLEKDDIHDEGTIVVNQWFSGRKTASLDDFVVGTVDQFLLLALKQKHLALRHLGFSKKVVIIDEVHSYDSYMDVYLMEAIRWMGAYNVPLIILSATLPAEKREEMISSYMRGKGIKWREVKKPEDGLDSDAYPLITYSDGAEAKQEKNFEKVESKKVKIIRDDLDNIYDIISKLFENDGVIGVVLNTVKLAQEVAEKCSSLFGAENIELLHSGFIATDRTKKENNLLKMIGKGADRPNKKIIIGTQVIEQSLDIDFDVLISELAPIDLLIQRVGRLHRHDIERSDFFKDRMLYVLGTNEDLKFQEGTSHVYEPYILTRSQYFLPEEIYLPDDISKLVQKVYGSDEIDLKDSVRDLYEKYHKDFDKNIKKKEDKASTYLLANPSMRKNNYKDTLVGLLSTSKNYKTEERAYAQVRDSLDTIEVIALKKCGQGYSTFSGKENLKDKIAEDSVAMELAKQTIKLPASLCQLYNIDKTIEELEDFNRKYLSDWQKNSWLRGGLGIIFDENNEFVLNGYVLNYNIKFGLSCKKIER